MASRLGSDSFSVVGWSMGAFVAIQLAATAPRVLDKVVLVDACAATSEAADALIEMVIERLGVVYPSVEQYLELVQRLGTIVPWSPLWEGYFGYELETVDGGVDANHYGVMAHPTTAGAIASFLQSPAPEGSQ